MIGNNSCGTHSLLGGKTVDNVEALKILRVATAPRSRFRSHWSTAGCWFDAASFARAAAEARFTPVLRA